MAWRTIVAGAGGRGPAACPYAIHDNRLHMIHADQWSRLHWRDVTSSR